MITVQVLLFIVACMLLAEAHQEGPDDCYQGEHFYPIHSKWASTVPLECVEYTCDKNQLLSKRECKPEPALPPPTSGVTCYPVKVSDNYFPYCCPNHRCINEKNPDCTPDENSIHPLEFEELEEFEEDDEKVTLMVDNLVH